MPQPTQVTAAEISRLAGVTRATVSNWRRRHPDFPAPTGGTEASPTYDLDAVRAWLAARGQLPASTPTDGLRIALRATAADPAHRSRLLSLAVTASRQSDTELKKVAELSDEQLSTWVQQATRSASANSPETGDLNLPPTSAQLLRALLRCVAEVGAVQTMDVLAEGDANETKATSVYHTPTPLADLMAALLARPDKAYPNRVFDPACGTGALLLAAAEHGADELYGQDVLPLAAAQAAARLAVQVEVSEAQIRVGDSLRADAFPTLTADAVLCAPPYGQRGWGHEDLAYDPRWIFGLPARGEPELAWLQHCLAHLPPGGRAVLLMPPASAERPAGRRIRAEMLRSGALRAVVALPAGIAPPLHIGLHLWLLERPRSEAPLPSSVLLVDTAAPDAVGAAGEPTNQRNIPAWSTISRRVLDTWHDFTQQPDNFPPISGTARAVSVIDLLDEAVDLTPARHVRAAPAPVEPNELAEMAHELRSQLRRAVTGLLNLSSEASWQPAGAAPLSWRTASVADLVRGEALTLLRASVAIRSVSPSGPGSTTLRTLTARDVMSRRPASGDADEQPMDERILLQEGDIILPEMLPERAGTARVADAADAGHLLGRHLHLLRPDPSRLDSWFLAGFLSAESNLNAASSGSTVVRVDPRRLRIPLLPLATQRQYGEAFRQLNTLRATADLTNLLADETTRTLTAGLTGGALLPPETAPPAPSSTS
ncbi:N-6 DNA methylase [Micromonospora sonneratiae]|uniref:N-6 DNA methylase n=1 Tax=Micromonospora sonneratiae TaxID=1184706 RepID=A0ABW3Y7D6_9ACTN